MRIATSTFVLALAVLALMAGGAQAGGVQTITDPFVQANDDTRENRDSFTIRGRIDATGSDPVVDGVAGGATVSMFQASSAGGAFAGYGEIDSLSFAASDCRAANGGLSLFCKDATTGSTLRVRGTIAQPASFRVVARVRGQEFDPGKPFGTPLAGEVDVGSPGGAFASWLGVTATCRLTHNGDRTTCTGEGVAPTPAPATPTPTPAPTPTPTPAVCGTSGTYTDNCNGTVTDSSTGLVWEQKTDDSGVHDVDNTYSWTVSGDPWPFDGTAKTVFLDQLNCQGAYTSGCTPWLGYADWRLPTIDEFAGPGAYPDYATGGIVDFAAPACTGGSPCINAIFGPTTVSSYYWSSSTDLNNPYNAWFVDFSYGGVINYDKSQSYCARAVRGGP